MSDVEFKEVQDFVQVDKLKIVACDGRGKCMSVITYYSCNIQEKWYARIVPSPYLLLSSLVLNS